MTDVALHDQQARVTAHFQGEPEFWDRLYGGADVFSVIHQHRAQVAMTWIDSLGLQPEDRVLEVGCGAGLFATELARRGFQVTATDSTPAMVELTDERARGSGLAEGLVVRVADAHALDLPDASFALVVALGVIPWLHSPAEALGEMARVLAPGGYLVVNADNRARLINLADPLTNPLLKPAKRVARGLLRRPPSRRARINSFRPSTFDRELATAGVDKIKGLTFGFGSFTFLGRPVLSEEAGVRLHRRLQGLADAGVPAVRAAGAQYIVLARKRRRP